MSALCKGCASCHNCVPEGPRRSSTVTSPVLGRPLGVREAHERILSAAIARGATR